MGNIAKDKEMKNIHLVSYESWRDGALCGTYDPLTTDQLAEMFTATCKYGSGNLWTGTTGTLATYVRLLLREVEHLRGAGSDAID